MKAILFPEVKKIEILDVDTPKLNYGEALIKVKYCSICGSDIHILNGHHPTAKFPIIGGHEFVGELVEINGENPQNLNIGDLVIAQPYFSCGSCGPCSQGKDNVCTSLSFMGAHRNGGFAQYVKVLIRKTYKVPENVSSKLASLVEPIAVAVHDVRRSGLKVGESALVIGGGPIGILIALVARHAGASEVVISEISQYRREFAEKLGFKTVNPLDSDFNEKINPNKTGYNVVFEVSGSQPGITTAINVCKIAGTIVIVGMAIKPYEVNLMQIFVKELKIEGVRIHSQYNFLGAIELLKSKDLRENFEKLISKTYNLEEAKEAFEYAQSGEDFFKVLIKLDTEEGGL